MKVKSKGKVYEYDKTLILLNRETHERLKCITKEHKISYDRFVNILLDNYTR